MKLTIIIIKEAKFTMPRKDGTEKSVDTWETERAGPQDDRSAEGDSQCPE